MRDRPRLDAVVFDAGGTLVRLDFEWMAECVAALDGAPGADALRRAEVEGRRRYDESVRSAPDPGDRHPLGSRGDIRAYFLGMLEAAGVPERARAAALERFVERQAGPGLWSRPMEGARAAIDGVAALGLRLAVVSNSDGRAAWHLERGLVREGIEFVVDSHHVRIEKPDPAIFRIALDRLGVAAERALYVGDIRSVDEAGSRAAGMRFVLLDPYGDYGAGADTIAEIGLLPGWVSERFAVPRSRAAPHESAKRGASAGSGPRGA